MKFIIYDKTGKILRTVNCPPTFANIQTKEGEFIIKGSANDVTHKVVNGKVVDKIPEEIKAEKPPEIPKGKRLASIMNEQWQGVLSRLENLEKSNGQ